MNARHLTKNILAIGMASVIAVGCSGGSSSGDETPQFESPKGRTVTTPPSSGNPVSGNDEGNEHQEILDAIQGATEAANSAAAAANAAKDSSDAAKTSSDEAKMKAEEAAANAKKAESKADKAGDKAELAAWVAGIGSALAIATSAIGDRIVYKDGDKDRDNMEKKAAERHDENLGAHAGTQGIAAWNQELLNRSNPVISDIRKDQTAQGDQLNTIARSSSQAATRSGEAVTRASRAADGVARVEQRQTTRYAAQEKFEKDTSTRVTDAETRITTVEDSLEKTKEELAQRVESLSQELAEAEEIQSGYRQRLESDLSEIRTQLLGAASQESLAAAEESISDLKEELNSAKTQLAGLQEQVNTSQARTPEVPADDSEDFRNAEMIGSPAMTGLPAEL